MLHLLTDEVFSTECYSNPAVLAKYPGSGSLSFLSDALPMREGERPRIGNAVAPQREVGAGNSQDLRKVSQVIYSCWICNDRLRLQNHLLVIWDL